jgi:hypothetical protein
VTADENGERPGHVEAAAGSLPWTMDGDGSTWRAQLPDGRTAVIERLDDADGQGSAFFLPKEHESRQDFSVGPVCAVCLPLALILWVPTARHERKVQLARLQEILPWNAEPLNALRASCSVRSDVVTP